MAGGRKAKSDEEMQFDLELGQKIARARRQRGMTLEALAVEVGISRQRLHWYETGRSAMPANLVEAFARVLDLSVGEIFRPVDKF